MTHPETKSMLEGGEQKEKAMLLKKKKIWVRIRIRMP